MREHQSSTGFNKEGRLRRKRFKQKHQKSTRFYSVQQAPGSASGPGGRWFESTRPDFLFKHFQSSDLVGLSRSEDFSSTDSSTSKILPHRILFATIASMLYFFTMIPELIPPHEYNYLVKITEENARDQYVMRRILSRLHEARRAGTEESDLDVA